MLPQLEDFRNGGGRIVAASYGDSQYRLSPEDPSDVVQIRHDVLAARRTELARRGLPLRLPPGKTRWTGRVETDTVRTSSGP